MALSSTASAPDEAPATTSDSSLGDVLCEVRDLHHRYGEHVALAGVDLSVRGGEIVAVLGKNGSGKTTLFRLLSTLLPIQKGTAILDGLDVSQHVHAVRSRLGIIFQSPSLDIKLTVDENLRCQGALYGLSGRELSNRCDELLDQFALTDRRRDLCQTLSGGLKRRVELAKGLLHRPRVMLLDEPSTGLDPAARLSLWEALQQLADSGVAVLLTTHLMEEAAKANRVVLMDQGQKIADDTPSRLRAGLGGGVLTIVPDDIATAKETLQRELQLDTQTVGETLRTPCDAPELVATVSRILGDNVQSISIGRPNLEDVFVAKTGKQFQ
ncbi:ATP-binding cassette domain-containing protein [Rhodopirellula sp. JC740]|uniref:ATP-binding cassette domain-containing protein n=1 Tax=Rhodopirellula halodulae TaxID=2894198 RepID=A0ABS8NGH2_9BACT|nr:ATP-binding cassette domain-containing protein [Rhodopirellula sp. JC740]MCC9642647.1 ATP-binding cassette domain-containing protein [Rhodopirellula sp. JC740]